jgi:hypothetical protein
MNTDQKRHDADNHTLPRWVSWVQSNLLLSFLILAEAYLLGTLMALGWVANIQDPASWGWYSGIGVVLFISVGAMIAGIALQCSLKAATCFSQGKWGMGLFNFLGVLVFAGCEIWASLSERSANLRPTPADAAVLHLLGISGSPVSPTIVIVALLLPFATLYFGFSQQGKAAQESEDERRIREANELASVQHKQALALAKARGRRQQIAAYLTKEPDGTPDPTNDAVGGADAGQDVASDGGLPAEMGADLPGQTDADEGIKGDALPVANQRPLTHGMWTAHDLRQYVLMRYNETLSQAEASRAIAGLPTKTKAVGVRGQPYCAPKRDAKAWADKRFTVTNVAQASAE